jgi:hypothetical protein
MCHNDGNQCIDLVHPLLIESGRDRLLSSNRRRRNPGYGKTAAEPV